MKRSFLVLIILLKIAFVKAQGQERNLAVDQGIVQSKNYYLLTLIENDNAVKHLIATDTLLNNLVQTKKKQLNRVMTQSGEFHHIVAICSFSQAEITTTENELSSLFDHSAALRNLVKYKLIPSGCYRLVANLSPKQQLLKAWEQDAKGINWAIAVYGDGQPPHYDIDSISFNVNARGYTDTVKSIISTMLVHNDDKKLFFELPMQCALAFLSASGRQDAANYEPMEKGVNKAAFQKAKQINWSDYPYTALLVPGEGPEQYDIAIDQIGKARCKLAAQAYKEKLAPFILVSGGKVHPYKTKFCEAEQMKKYLMDSLKVPESAIIMEPHARHTTTNMRNGVRLMIHYGFPLDKPGLIVTDKDDNDYIAQMDKRCINELGYVPYKLGKRINDTQLEFYPLKEALQINSTEPLDP